MIDDATIEEAARAFVGADFMDESEREAVIDGMREAAPVIRAAALAEVRAALERRAAELLAREHRFKVQGQRAGVLADVDARRCEVVEALAIVAGIAPALPTPPDPRGPGIIGSHWIHPSPLVTGRPREAVTSGAPPINELAAARERRDGTPISLDARIDASGAVILDVDLGAPPAKR